VSEAAAPAAEEWRRTSPLGYAVGAVVNLRNMLLPMAAAMFGTQGWDGGFLYVLPGVILGIGLTFLFSWIAWRHFRYRIGDSDIRVERGLFNRTARSVPYERIQDVSLEQSLVPRLFGMVQVKFETGAGGKDELKIQYVTEAEGAALRETVRARKAGESERAGAPEAAAEPEARTLFAMDTRRLLTFGLFEFSLVVFAVLGGAAQQFDFLLPFDIWDHRRWIELVAGPQHWLRELGIAAQAIGVLLALAALAVVGLVTGVGRTVLRDYGFRLEETPKGLRRRRGLLTRTDVVMPVHRVQALQVTTGILRRRWGWHGLSVVSLAQDAKAGNHVVAPFARMEEIAPVVETTGFRLPGEAAEWHRASLRQRNDGIALSAGLFAVLAAGVHLLLSRFAPAPADLAMSVPTGLEMFVLTGPKTFVPAGLALAGAFFAVREWQLWRRRRHALDSGQIYVQHGWLAPRLDIASRIKLQSVEIAQGPLARRRGYANVRFGVAGGALEINGIPLDDARTIRRAVLESIASVDFSRLP
jgi:putative membrane protein